MQSLMLAESPLLPESPDMGDLIRRSEDLIYPTNVSDDHLFDSLARVVRRMEDDPEGDAVAAIAILVRETVKAPSCSMNCSNWGVPSSRVLASIRSCSTPSDARRFLEGITRTAPANQNWAIMSGILQLINPTIFPIWTPEIAAKFGVRGYSAIELNARYASFCEFVWDSLAAYGSLAQDAVRRHVDCQRTAVHAMSLLLSWTYRR
ncbi:MAG: hypothetical protein JJ959_06905 [Nisaea sp.]|uniref:hypothetical protein n=1 Tax=Nisaea sp. TaxID=2024842 RepID=UPI001B139B2D|nr:hypothetical protein [Nisaea sp.]MBO6560248.1 hypothetical protein [Nisaea sp.]